MQDFWLKQGGKNDAITCKKEADWIMYWQHRGI